jgi:phosphotriesterase-related protein
MANTLSGKIQTVTGLIDPSAIGITLAHEHLLIDINFTRLIPREAGAKGRSMQPVTLESLWHIRRDWTNSADRLLDNEAEMIEEAGHFKRAGGVTIVDATPIGLGRDPLGLARISRGSGVQVVMGAGYYSMEVPQPGLDDKSVDDIAGEIVHDIEVGFGWPAVRSGLIGEIASSFPRHPNEVRVLQAAVLAQQQTGAGLLIHTGRDPGAPMETIDRVKEAGGDPSRVTISHLDRTIFDGGRLAALAETGCYLEYDLFGQESAYYPYNPNIDMPNDAGRVDWIRFLIDRGHLDQVLVGHDLGNKWRLRKYGGPGYAHLVENVVPIMRRKGFTDAELNSIFVDNPGRALTFQ